MRVACVSALVWCLSLGAVSAQQAADSVPLFNGRDLTGWHNINCAPGTFTVRDGEIYSTGVPICEIRTERMYENFVLDVEWMHLTPKGNAGVFIWSDPLPAVGQPFLRAVEVQVLDGRETPDYTSHGDIFPIHGATMTPDRPHPNGWPRSLPSEKRAKPAGEWNHYRITADRGRVTLEVNGKAVSGGYDISPRKGYIALEAEGAPVRFRNLRIRELPSAGALTAHDIAHVDEGYRSLYTGVDLSGWKGDSAGHFAPADWQIEAGSRAGKGTLVSATSFRNVDFFIDWRCGPPQANEQPPPQDVTADAAINLVVAGASDERLRLSCRDRIEGQAEGSRWNRTRVSKRAGRLEVELNGRPLTTTSPAMHAGIAAPISISHEGGPMTIANIFVAERP
jgi:hypothetical protein